MEAKGKGVVAEDMLWALPALVNELWKRRDFAFCPRVSRASYYSGHMINISNLH